MRKPLTIGWKETISLPEWGIFNLSAKSDTGARACALDVTEIRERPDGKVEFEVILDRGARTRTEKVVATPIGRTRVRSSNGKAQDRLRVRTRVRVGEFEKEAEFTLVNRKRMLHRVLLGRNFLEHDFLVDSSRRFLFGPKRKPVKRAVKDEPNAS